MGVDTASMLSIFLPNLYLYSRYLFWTLDHYNFLSHISTCISNKQSKYNLSKLNTWFHLQTWSCLVILIIVNSAPSWIFLHLPISSSFPTIHSWKKKNFFGVFTACKVLWEWSLKHALKLFPPVAYHQVREADYKLSSKTYWSKPILSISFANNLVKATILPSWTRAIAPGWVPIFFLYFLFPHQSYHQGDLTTSLLCINLALTSRNV